MNFFRDYFVRKFGVVRVDDPKTPIEQPVMPNVPRMNPRYKVYTDTVKILAHPGNSQLNNRFSPRSACNVTSLQIALSLDSRVTDDELFALCNSTRMAQAIQAKYPRDWGWISQYFTKGCANEVWVVILEAALMTLGGNWARIIFNLSNQMIIDEINQGYPVIINGRFTHAGHFVVVVGYDRNTGHWIINDPYGDWTTSYRNKQAIENLRYPMRKLTIGRGNFLSSMAILVHADKRVPV
jgi:uncharacterized protein YvpB